MESATSGAPEMTAQSIKLPAVISIAEAHKLRDDLRKLLNSEADVSIDASAVERIDTAGLQLLAAFAESIEHSRRAFTWQDVGPAVISGARRLGLSRLLRLGDNSIPVEC